MWADWASSRQPTGAGSPQNARGQARPAQVYTSDAALIWLSAACAVDCVGNAQGTAGLYRQADACR